MPWYNKEGEKKKFELSRDNFQIPFNQREKYNSLKVYMESVVGRCDNGNIKCICSILYGMITVND